MRSITVEELENHRKNKNAGRFVLVLLKLEGCKSCEAYEPVFADLSKNFPEIEFTVLECKKVEDLPLFAGTTVPCVYLFVDGFRLAEAGGVRDKAGLRNTIKEWVGA